jgi:hypothetical protein
MEQGKMEKRRMGNRTGYVRSKWLELSEPQLKKTNPDASGFFNYVTIKK